ncbi:MAG TPA: cation:proton antiporter [Solirubrobacterales bacterium]|nr:cation:proton antiporter [Solirubrobacterales bacterium]
MVIAAGPGFGGGDPYAAAQLFVGLVVFAAVLALSRQGNRAFSPAMVYLLLGVAAAGLARALGVDWLDPLDDSQAIERISEFAVIIALFGAGLKLDRPLRWARWTSTARLILIVMPLTIAAVAAFGAIAMGLSIGAAIVLGAALSPTDPVLASDVQVGPPGEGREREPEPQFALTSEAGLNDGVAFPFVILGTLIAAEGGTGWFAEWLVADVIYGIGVGVVLGAAAGYLIAVGARWLRDRGWLLAELDGWLSLAAVLAIYGAAELVGAYGFLAAFAGGLGFRRHAMGGESHGRVHAGADTVEKVAELTLVLLLGSLVTSAGLAALGVAGWLLVPLLLFAIRPLATFGAFARSPVPLRERAFIGWFGIRGIGSLYYAAVVVHAGVLDESEAVKVFWSVVVLTAVSILVHGVTAASLTRRIGAAAARDRAAGHRSGN